KAIAQQMIKDPAQFAAFDKIVSHESGWDFTATNASSGAYGLVQALPASKMASAGSDWKSNPATQIKWGLDYMNSRYGSPVGAWNFWQNNHWY
ncbi:aggregation-promoting factor C-terminal-like domain-containing protein, partial [Streptomyces lavendulae]